MSLRESRFILGIILPVFYEITLIQSYLFFTQNEVQLFLFLPGIIFIFPVYFVYIYSPYLIYRLSGVNQVYSEALIKNIDEIFLLKDIDLDPVLLKQLHTSIQDELIPELLKLFRRGYIDSFFIREEHVANQRMLSFREVLFLLSLSFGLINFLNLLIILYLAFNSIDFDFFYMDQITTPINVIIFALLFLSLTFLSFVLFRHTRRQLQHLIQLTSYNLSSTSDIENLRVKTRNLELDSIRRFPLVDKIGSKLASNWDLVAKLYLEFIEAHIKEELHDFSRKEITRSLVLEQYSSMLNHLDLPPKKKKELELQFYLGQGVTDAIEEIVDSEEETESIKIDILYARKKLEIWDEISNDEHISTFLFSWRSIEGLFRNLLWKRSVYPKEDQSWPSIVDTLLREKLLTTQENRTLKKIRLRRNAMLHRSQDRYISREDLEELLNILQSVLDRS
ncbi:hypothetical protein [Candidatus Hodarchaeum mangrovi]